MTNDVFKRASDELSTKNKLAAWARLKPKDIGHGEVVEIIYRDKERAAESYIRTTFGFERIKQQKDGTSATWNSYYGSAFWDVDQETCLSDSDMKKLLADIKNVKSVRFNHNGYSAVVGHKPTDFGLQIMIAPKQRAPRKSIVGRIVDIASIGFSNADPAAVRIPLGVEAVRVKQSPVQADARLRRVTRSPLKSAARAIFG